MPLTHTASNSILAALAGKSGSAALCQNCYVGLSTSEPNVYGTFIEPTGNGYSRVFVGTSSSAATQKFGSPALGVITNTDIISFPECTNTDDNDGWGTIGYFGIFSAATGGTLMAYGALTTPVSPTNGYVPVFRAGQLTLTLA